jgi:hypothetical protein
VANEKRSLLAECSVVVVKQTSSHMERQVVAIEKASLPSECHIEANEQKRWHIGSSLAADEQRPALVKCRIVATEQRPLQMNAVSMEAEKEHQKGFRPNGLPFQLTASRARSCLF